MSERNDGGVWCHEVLGMLDLYVDGSLSEDQLQAVQVHVQACTHCDRFGSAYARVVSVLRGPANDPPPPHLLHKVQAQLWGAE